MAGKVLLLDRSASRRAALRARLAAAWYDVVATADAAEAAVALAASRPDLVLAEISGAADGFGGLVAALRSDPVTAGVPIVGLCPADRADLRLAALAAGADDVLSRPLDEGVLLARLRNLVRRRDVLSDLAGTAPGVSAFGMAEAAGGFEAPGRVALVSDDPGAAAALAEAVSPHLRDQLGILTPDAVLAGPAEGAAPPDLFVVADDAGGPGGGLRLCVQLLGSDAARHAALCLLRAAPAPVAEDAMAFDLGVGDVIPAGASPAEIALRLRALLRRKRWTDSLRARLRDGLRLAMTDPLTGLHNRRYAEEQLALIAGRARALGATFAVMLVDLDRFKAVNDQHGHAAGDAVLVEVARRLQAGLRGGDLLARIGGEEFLVALPGVGVVEAEAVAGRLCAAMQERRFLLPGGLSLALTASIGLAIGNDGSVEGETVRGLIERADRALLGSKAAGRNQVTISRKVA